MPVGVTGIELLKYFRQPESAFGKSIQRDWQFNALFIYNPFESFEIKSLMEDFPPIIQPHHFIDVSIPTYSFERKIMMYGQIPRTFPLLNFEGFEIDITLEEDEQATIEYFINWNQRKIINSDGSYNAPNDSTIKAFVVEVQDKMGIPVVYYLFHDLYFLKANPVTYSYTSNNSVRRSVTFGVDRMTTFFTKQNIASRAVKGAIPVISRR